MAGASAAAAGGGDGGRTEKKCGAFRRTARFNVFGLVSFLAFSVAFLFLLLWFCFGVVIIMYLCRMKNISNVLKFTSYGTN